MMNLLFATRLTPSKWSSGRLMFVIFSALLICAHWSPLAYGATATAVVQAVNSATPQLFYPVVYNSYSDAPRTWKSTLTVQNPSQTTNAAVQLTFYNENGQAITPNGLGSITNNFTLAPKASVTIPIETVNGLTTNARYTVVATSDQPLTGVNWVRVFNSSTNTESHETFIGFAPQTATTVYLPSLVKAANGFSSNVAIQNLSNSTISNAQLTIWDQNGNQALQLQAPPIAPYSAWYPSFSALTNGFSGALSVSASGPLALVDLQIGGSNGVTLLAYRGAATGAQTLYAPFLTTQSSASAALTIQNTSNSQAATVSVTNADAVDNTQVNIPPRASRSISYSANSHAAQFSATITANQAVIAIVTQQTSSGGGYTYPAFEQSLTSFALPLEVKAYQNAGSNANFNNVTTLFNPGVTTAQVVINYSNNSTTQHVVNPGQYLSIAAATLGNLSSNFAGSAFVTSSQPLFAFNGMSGQNANGDLLAAYGAVAPQTPAAIITKSASVAYLKPGDPLTYTLSVAAGASGGSALIVDLLPSQLLTHSYSVGASVVVTPTGNEDYRWTAAVPAGGGQIVVHGIVDPALANDLTLVNTAAITVNSNSASSSANVIVDATPPDTTIASKPTNPSNNPAPTFSFSANDGAGSGVASYAYQLDNGAWTSCSAGCQLPSVSDGSHTLNVRALDRVGHVDPTPASYTWTVDTTPPTSPVLTAPPNGSTINNIQTVTLTWNAVADADRAGYKVNFNGVTTDVGNTTNYNVGPVANGVYTWTVAAYDTLGNTGAFAGVATFTINVNAPQRLSLSPQANSHTAPVNTSVAITLSKPINASTVNTRTLAIHAMQTGRRLQAYNTNGATSAFSPTPPFKPGELIEASATSGLQDTDGFALFPPTVWHFRAGVHGGTGQFTVGNTFGSNHAADAAIGDVDGDGDVDLIVADYSGPNKLYLNDGDGTFDTTSYVVGPGNDVTWAVALGDLNGDGKLDLVVANLQGANVVYMNDGVGNPFDTISYTYSSSPLDNGQALALGDVDGDGDLDLAVGHNATLSTKLYINDGSGNPFDTTNDNIETPGMRAGDMSFGDVNNDGRLDLIMAGDTGNKVLLNDGSGNPFDTTSYSFGIGSNSTTKFEMVAGDFNGDQKLDVAISHRGSSRANIVYLNDGSGNPFDTLTNTVGTGNDCTTALTAGDVDGDGDLDLALGNWGSGCVGGGQDAVYLNDGDGTFDTTAYNFGSNSFANMTHALEMADLDGDGDLDIVAAIWGNTPQISYLNANEPLPGTATPTPTATAPVTPTATSTPTPTTQPGTPTDTPTLTPTTQPGTATVTPTPTLTPTPTVTPIATCSLVVLNTNDSGAGSLRQAIADASATCNQIAFANGLTGQTIHLASPLTIAKDVAINGSGRKLTISGDTNSDGSGDVAVFTINAGNVQLANLTIANGFGADGLGGGVSISPGAHVQITQSTLRDNTSDNGALASGGGGIYNTGVLTLTNSTISGNQAANIAGLGGGIHSGFGSVTTIRYSTITGNSAPSDGLGGGINVEGGSVTLIGSIVSGNSAPTGPEIAVNNGGTLVINGRNVIGANGNAGLDGATPGATDLVPAGAVSTVLNPTLADNGGDTFTHALVVGGAAYDAIGVNSLGCGVTITVDQRNITRPSGAGCDVGAVESTTTIPTPTPTLPTSDATAVAQPGQPASLNYTDPSGGGVVVQIPAGAINQPTTFLYADHETPSHTGAFQFAGRTFTLTAYRDNSAVTGFTFQQPVTLVIDYTDSDVAGLDENHLALFFYDVANGVWSDQGITIVSRDLVNNRITVQINHLTEFAMGTTNRSYMPVITK